jgi:hypothetical protein
VAARGNRKAPAAGRGRAAPKARGKGIQAIDLKTDEPDPEIREAITRELAARAKDRALNKVADAAANFGMEGASGDRLAAAEDEATTTPVPERVCLLIFSMHLLNLTVLCLYRLIKYIVPSFTKAVVCYTICSGCYFVCYFLFHPVAN